MQLIDAHGAWKCGFTTTSVCDRAGCRFLWSPNGRLFLFKGTAVVRAEVLSMFTRMRVTYTELSSEAARALTASDEWRL
jgi:hypothetical protein